MYSQITPQSDSTFVLRRLLELMPWPSLFFPVFLGLGVLFMLVLFRSKKRLKTLAVWTPLILLAGALYVGVGYSLVGLLSWWLVLVPTLAIAFFYVGMMYFKDAHTVHFTWAGFLGMLRVGVYVLLGVCFLLPGCQEYITTETESKVIVLFDVSASMNEGAGRFGRRRRHNPAGKSSAASLTTPYVQHGSEQDLHRASANREFRGLLSLRRRHRRRICTVRTRRQGLVRGAVEKNGCTPTRTRL